MTASSVWLSASPVSGVAWPAPVTYSRRACNAAARVSQTASKAGLWPPEITSVGNGAPASRPTGSCSSHGRRRTARIAGPPYISADVATGRGLDAVGPYDNAGHDIVAVLEALPHAGWLVGQAGQPVIQLDTFRWHRPGKQTLKGRAMECQEWCANLDPVPLAHRLGPQEPAILPGADLKSRRHIGDLGQIDAETLQQKRLGPLA